MDPLVNLGAHMVHHPVEGAERRQVDPGIAQRLDGPVDQVGRIAHRLGGVKNHPRDHPLTRLGKCARTEVDSDGRPVAVKRLFALVFLNGWRLDSHSKLCRQIRQDRPWNFLRGWEAPGILAGLQQCREGQAAGIASRHRPDEDALRLAQSIPGLKFLMGQPLTKARVSGAVNGGHGVSGKGAAGAAARGLNLQGDRSRGFVSTKELVHGRLLTDGPAPRHACRAPDSPVPARFHGRAEAGPAV
jgi:hypothetical protein